MDDWIYATTPLFNFDCWNDEIVELVVNHIINYNEEPLVTNVNAGIKDKEHPTYNTDINGNYIYDKKGNPIVTYHELPAKYEVTSKDTKLYEKLKHCEFPAESFKVHIRDRLDWRYISEFVIEKFPKYSPLVARYSKALDARGLTL